MKKKRKEKKKKISFPSIKKKGSVAEEKASRF